MASTEPEVIVLDHCRISPPPGSVVGKSLPVTFFDLFWINQPPIQCLLFYDSPHTRTQFTQTVVPILKHSLSLALKHFFPLAGNLVLFPSTSASKPEILYIDGDSVSLTIAECLYDFNYLTDKIPRNSAQLLPLLAQLPPSVKALDNSTLVPLLAIQVTLFPNYGICVGITHNHVVGDGSSMAGFRKAWALITKFNSEAPLLAEGPLPFYDRSVIKVADGLYEFYWNHMRMANEPLVFQSQIPPSSIGNTVRASFIVSPTQILQLKKLVLDQRPNLHHVSSFVVVCAYAWSCLAKLRVAVGEKVCDDELEHFTCPVNCRTRLDPPIPTNYFGNCLAACFATVRSTQLLGKEGFLIGAELVGEAISNLLNNEEGVLKDAKNWLSEAGAMKGREVLGVTGSPKFSLHDTDFGWGMPKKFELGFHGGSVSLNGCKDFDGGMEVGLTLPEQKMNDFANIFISGLKNNE